MRKSRWMQIAGWIGILLFLFPNFESVTTPQGHHLTVRLGTFSWFQYHTSNEEWTEGDRVIQRKSTAWNASFVNLSVLAGLLGVGLLGLNWWRGKAGPSVEQV